MTFYPEDTSFNTLVQTIRKSCRTVELFEIARTVVGKNDRFVVVVSHRPSSAAATPTESSEAGGPAPRPVFHLSVPDGLPFESDEAAVSHVLGQHLDKFFDTAEVEIEAPKGNFQVINRCTLTGELLGPPNYHRYNQIVQQHYGAKIASRMSLDAYRTRIETVRDPEIVNQWLAKMKKATRYTWKLAAEASSAVPASAPVEGAAEGEAGGGDVPAAPSSVPNFDTLEDARYYLLSQARDKVVRTTEHARFHGRLLETLPPGEIRRAVEGALERQRRFPLDTANALRGRLRREHFTIFKKGSKGISYVCAVKRKFRIPGQTFSDSIGALISFIETNPMVRASELAPKLLGIATPPPPPPKAAAPEPTVTPAAEGAESAPVAAAEPSAPKVEVGPSIEDRAKLSRLQGDLVWLVREGYVTEFIDGRLFAPPPMVEARKKEIENEEHDPENFPEAPPAAAAPESTPATDSGVPTVDVPPAAVEPAAAPVETSEPVPNPAEPQPESAAPAAEVTTAADSTPAAELPPVAETPSEAKPEAPSTPPA